jgi:hypothetical protein
MEIIMPDDIFKILIKEEFYYPITQISIEFEKELLIVNLTDKNAYCSLLSSLHNLLSLKLNDVNSFKTFPDEKNLCISFNGNILGALLFLREHDSFSENTYQRALEELSERSKPSAEEIRIEISAEGKQKNNEISQVNNFSFFNFGKENSENESSEFKNKCSIQ